jgi:DNA primase
MNDLQELISKGKPFLRQYLEEHGVEIVKNGGTEFFKCISPEHADRNPSNGFIKGTEDQQFHCFSCQASGDIYTAAAFIEGKPLYGLGFIRENVEYILKKYSVEYDPVEFTEEQLSAFRYDSVYHGMYKLMTATDKDTGNFKYIDITEAQKRGWNREICGELGIGSVIDYKKFLKTLADKTRISEEELVLMGIRDDLFGPDFITFCIRDWSGEIKGVVARYTKYTKDCTTPKYKNTSIQDNPFYHKDKLLYCMEIAKKYESHRLDIFEGYGSAVTAQQEGYRNCVALGGTALTDNHVDIIRSLNFKHINLVLDQDQTGAATMEKYIEKFAGYNGLKVTIMNLPFSEEDKKISGQNDPDFFIRKYGITEYRKLKTIGVFEHMIEKNKLLLDLEHNPSYVQNFAKSMIKLIINQSDLLERGQMINTLSKHTGLDKDDIRDEILRIETTNVSKIKDDLMKTLKRANSADDLQYALNKTISNIESSGGTKKDRYLVSVTESVEFFDQVFVEMNAHKEGLHGWITGFTALDNMLDGIPKPTKAGRAIGLAGAPQHGKSAIMLNIAVNLALNNKDIAICYWAIDDNRKSLAYRLVSMISKVPMKKVINNVKRTQEDLRAMREAQDILRQLTNDRKLVFKDDRYGRTQSKAEDWIKTTQDETGNPILFCIDSLHNVQGNDNSDTRVKLLNSSMWAKSLTAKVPCTVMMTLEMVKNRTPGQKPILTQISESAKMEFDLDTAGIVWNEAVGNYCSVENPVIKARWGVPGKYKPIIELDFQKNKAGAGERGSIYFMYDNETTGIVGCSSVISSEEDLPQSIELPSSNGRVYKISRDVPEPEEEEVSEETGW